MAVLKCKMCGGELAIREGISIVKCDYCGNTNTLPKENSANNHDLFARANELRARCEFDLAERAYEKIIEVAPQEAEAYWGLVLCKYGIEYVEDPKTKKRIPTCHRASFEAITADYNYQKAIEYADVVSRPVYEEEARVIDTIQKEILALSYKEEKYDVFICYKETDDNGKRTEDSAIANDIYYQLTQEGYKVFYAAITLEDKLGQDYEPIIFAALNSAKVMLVVGTKAEYFNAVWVKNEWSRYLKIMKQDRTKLMFPCYKGISAYELPDELSHMQAQDMGKIGFINDLIRGIKKVVVKEKPKKEASSEVAATKVAPSKMNPTLRRAFIFIEDGNWEEANKYLEKVLDDEPENAFAYLGKLLIDLKVKKQEKLADLAQTFDNNPNYKKAYKFADEELKEKLAGYNEAISKRNDEKSKDEQYSAALTFVSKAKTEEDYKQAGRKFSALSGWKDSSRRAKDCFDKAEAIRKDAIYTKALALAQSKDPNEIKKAAPLFESIPDWKDSTEILVKIPDLCETARKNAIYEDALQKFNGTNIEKIKEAQKQFLTIFEWRDAKQKAELCVKRVQELEEKEKQDKLAREKAERERQIAQAKKKKLIKKVSIISTSTVVAIATVIILLFTLILPTINFNKATDLLNAGKYDEAMAIYKELDGFGNSTNKINVIEAINTVEDGDYENGIEGLLENGATVTISYDTAGGELNTINIMSARSASATKGILLMSAITAYADEVNVETSFTYNNVSEFEGLKPSTRNGYTFKKWTLVACSPEITKDTNKVSLTFIAEWTAKSYTVTYDLDGGSVNGENIIGYNPDDESFTLINPTRTGYTFIGWTGTDLTDKTMEVTVPSGSYGNREYTANWQANTYTVTYDANGGTSSKTEDTATYDEGFTLATVERKGYTFLGWFVGETKYEDFDNWELTNGLDLVAEWKINAYTITYTLNGGSATNTETYTVEDTVVINAPEKTGYTFDGWTGTGLSEETKSITLAKGTIGDKEYIANWTAKTYKVTFNANGGTASKTEDTATYDSNFTLATAERKGYEFVGWKADGKTYTTGDWKTDKNVELVAEWKIKNYEITYHLDGGNAEGNPATYTLNDTITLINPTREGYTFTGWTATDLSGKTMTVTIAKDSIGNREFTATWTANTYKVTYNANGGTVSKTEDVATFDGDFTLATAERRGYDFVAWKADGETFANGAWKTAKDIELVAEWKIINYAITYDLDGGSVTVTNPATYTVEDVVKLNNPTKTGYTFAGWTGTDLNGKTMTVTIVKDSIGNREYRAIWIANIDTKYTVEYYLQNLNDGKYTLEEKKELVGETDSNVNALVKDFEHFTYDDRISVVNGKINGDGSLVLRVYYTRNNYVLATKLNDENIGKIYGTTDGVYPYNYQVTLTAETKKIGYIFLGWYQGEDVVCKTENFVTIIETDVEYTAIWKVDPRMTYFNFTSTDSICTITGIKNKTIKEIIIPDYVTSISKGAFQGCSQLEHITIPFTGADNNASGNPWDEKFGFIFGYEMISTSLYSSGNGWAIPAPQDKYGMTWQWTETSRPQYGSNYLNVYYYYYYIPTSLKSVTVLGKGCDEDAFNGCGHLLINIEIESIEAWCNINFTGNLSNPLRYADNVYLDGKLLTDIIIPSTITQIKNNTFSGCSSLTSVTIPNSVTSIGSSAFSDCTSLTSVVIPDSVTSIGGAAFFNCSSLTNVYIESIESWCNINFESGSSNPFSYAKNLYLNNQLVTEVVIPNNVTTLKQYAFYNCDSLISIVIPKSITEVKDYVFISCDNLECIYFKGDITDWYSVSITESNNVICEKIYYYSDSEPILNDSYTAYNDNYWRYVDGIPTPWIYEG